MPMPTLQQIIGTITGKVAFERTQANFTTIKDTHNTLETVVGTKAPNADLVAHKAEKASRTTLGHIKLQEDWITLSLQTGWSGNIRCAKNDLGFVTIIIDALPGVITQETIIATLPEGYRPSRVFGSTVNDGGNSKNYDIRIDVLGNIRTAEVFLSEGYKTNIISYYVG